MYVRTYFIRELHAANNMFVDILQSVCGNVMAILMLSGCSGFILTLGGG